MATAYPLPERRSFGLKPLVLVRSNATRHCMFVRLKLPYPYRHFAKSPFGCSSGGRLKCIIFRNFALHMSQEVKTKLSHLPLIRSEDIHICVIKGKYIVAESNHTVVDSVLNWAIEAGSWISIKLYTSSNAKSSSSLPPSSGSSTLTFLDGLSSAAGVSAALVSPLETARFSPVE